MSFTQQFARLASQSPLVFRGTKANSLHRRWSLSCIALSAIALAAAHANAQWTATYLRPANASTSMVNGITDGKLVGEATISGQRRAWIWDVTNVPSNGTFTSTDAHPQGAPESFGHAIFGSTVYGSFGQGAQFQARFWQPGASTWTTLHPAGAESSVVRGADDTYQYGAYSLFPNGNRVCIWSGSTESRVDLHPAGWQSSFVNDVSDGVMYGHVRQTVNRAAAWLNRTPEVVLLHPANRTGSSTVFGAGDGFQAGWVTDASTGIPSACLWRGSAFTWRLIHPPNLYSSVALDTACGLQVGEVTVTSGTPIVPGVWAGTPESFTQLSTFTPAAYRVTKANRIDCYNGTTFVTGTVVELATGQTHAMLWTRPQPRVCDDLDFNNNGVIPEDQDVVDFFNAFVGTACAECSDIDFNNNGVFPEDQDVLDYLTVLAGGACS